MIDRRALLIDVAGLRIGAYEAIKVTGLELVGLPGERFEIADTVVACSCSKDIPKGKGRQGGIATGAATPYRQAVSIDEASASEVKGTIDTIVHIDNTPSAVETLAVGSAVASAATVVDIEDGNAPARPVLKAEVEGTGCGGGRTSVTDHQERRLFAVRGCEIRVLG